MIVQEPVQAAIWDALNHYNYVDATFLAERLFAEVSTDESQYLLATCYYRAGKPVQSYTLLQKRSCSSPECKYLLGRCCVEVGKYAEAEVILAGNILCKEKSADEIETEFGKLASHVFALLGAIYKSDRPKKATECYKRSLKLNPLFWSSFESLCQLGESVDPTEVFHVAGQCPGGQPPVSLVPPAVQQLKQDRQHTVQKLNSPTIEVTEVLSPVTELTTPQYTTTLHPDPPNMKFIASPDPMNLVNSQHTPENLVGNVHDQFLKTVTKAPKTTRKQRMTPSVGHGLLGQTLMFSPLSPSFGVLPLETPSPGVCKGNLAFITPSPVALQETNIEGKAPKKPITRRTQNQNQTLMPKPPLFNQSSNTNTQDVHYTQNNPPVVRRSSRLFGSSNSSSVKENNKSQSKSRFTSPKAVGNKSKSRLNKSKQDMNELNKGETISDTKPVPISEVPAQQQIAQMQQQSLVGALSLLQLIGKAYLALSQYNCWKAIELFRELPPHQLNTGWVLCQIGRAYFELLEHNEAEKTFAEVRRNEPYHIEGMEMYSTTLWHLNKEVELSALAQELVEMEKNCPEAWCATGNCFSLQKEHDTAIKFFERAIQISPNFAYAYTLLGHEFIVTEELDKAMACFRNAIRVNSRHYNAWYGMALIYYKQEKFSMAEVHFKKALLINPRCSALLCHIGVVQHAQQKYENALLTLNKAITADPRNPTCKFHRASVLFAIDRHKEALDELEELKKTIPKESLIYFLTGKIHKKMGSTDLALMNFSWAMDLDPKGLNNHIKEAIDKLYVTGEDAQIRINELELPAPGVSGSNSSLMDPDDILQAVESDESL